MSSSPRRTTKGKLIVELFSGTGSVGKVARRMGMEVISVDLDPKHNPDYAMDVREFPYKRIEVPDFVWASPPCTTYSIAATHARHRSPKTGKAWSEDAKLGDELLNATLKMIKYWKERNPKLRWCIENPRGYMRLMKQLQKEGIYRTTTSYNNFGWPVYKPTDFWTNFELILPPPKRDPGNTVVIGKGVGWAKSLREFHGSNKKSAVVLGMIPAKLIGSILRQMQASK